MPSIRRDTKTYLRPRGGLERFFESRSVRRGDFGHDRRNSLVPLRPIRLMALGLRGHYTPGRRAVCQRTSLFPDLDRPNPDEKRRSSRPQGLVTRIPPGRRSGLHYPRRGGYRRRNSHRGRRPVHFPRLGEQPCAPAWSAGTQGSVGSRPEVCTASNLQGATRLSPIGHLSGEMRRTLPEVPNHRRFGAGRRGWPVDLDSS